MDPVLYIVATPIGNLEDITLRAIRILGEVDVLACEDTRHTRILLDRHNIKKPDKVISYRERNEAQSVPGIIKLMMDGKSVAVVSDAGYPGISDAGYRLIAEAVANGIKIEVIPGASAIPVAILSSGLPTDSYTFLGFPNKKQGHRRRLLESVKDLPHTLIIYESPFRIGKLIADALEILGDRKAAVCVELTKMYEQTSRGYLSELLEQFRDKKVKGEITVAIAGNNPKFINKDG